jgi:hypothetical protein
MISAMFFFIIALLLVLGSPDATLATEVNVSGSNYAPSSKVKNARIAGTPEQVENSYIVVYRKNVNDSAISEYEARSKGSRGPAARYDKVKGFRGYWLETDRKGMEQVEKDPLVYKTTRLSWTRRMMLTGIG